MGKKITQEEFVNRARKLHRSRYDYSRVRYANQHTNVTIACPKHGPFEQLPCNHLSGKGCKQCAIDAVRLRYQKTKRKFVSDAKAIHGDKYTYASFDYKGAHKAGIIRCRKHGDFRQTPTAHLRGRGCPECASIQRATKLATPLPVFLKRARALFGDRYDYSRIRQLKNQTTKVEIICRRHDCINLQTPQNHLAGNIPCDLCSKEERQRRRDEIIEESMHSYCEETYGGSVILIDVFMSERGGKRRRRIRAKCIEHDVGFEQSAADFQRGKIGCKKCWRGIRISKQEIFEEPNKEAGKYKPVEALMTLVDWFRKQDPAQWPDEQRDAWREDLEPVVEFFQRL